jgi:hypothetical protein
LVDDPALYSVNTYSGDGSTVAWAISFSGGYILREHVKALTIAPNAVETPRALTFIDATHVEITPPVASGHTLRIYRETPVDSPLADFQDGAPVTSVSLDANAKQAVFAVAEQADAGVLIGASAGIAAASAAAAIASAAQAAGSAGSASSDAASAIAARASAIASASSASADAATAAAGAEVYVGVVAGLAAISADLITTQTLVIEHTAFQ